jgi:hypothetical protein
VTVRSKVSVTLSFTMHTISKSMHLSSYRDYQCGEAPAGPSLTTQLM